jgi:hypothetical protein
LIAILIDWKALAGWTLPQLSHNLKLGKIGRYSPEIIAEALISLMEGKDGQTDHY